MYCRSNPGFHLPDTGQAPLLLVVFGLAGRFAALGLSVVNAVAVLSLPDIAPAALQQHITWGVLLAALALYGVGRWSVDGAWLRARMAPADAPVPATGMGVQ